jgi:hypothetical protein
MSFCWKVGLPNKGTFSNTTLPDASLLEAVRSKDLCPHHEAAKQICDIFLATSTELQSLRTRDTSLLLGTDRPQHKFTSLILLSLLQLRTWNMLVHVTSGADDFAVKTAVAVSQNMLHVLRPYMFPPPPLPKYNKCNRSNLTTVYVVQWSEFLAANSEVPGSIPGLYHISE